MQFLTDLVGGVMGFIVRTLLFLAGTVFMLSLMAASAVGLGALLLWRLVTGKRPLVPRLSDLAGVRAFGFDPRAGWPRAHAGGEVVDAEVREIRDDPSLPTPPRQP